MNNAESRKGKVLQFGDPESIEYANGHNDPESKYIFAPAEIIEEANELIEKHHKHLKRANIAYMFNKKTMKSKGRLMFGKCVKCSERDKQMHGYDFLIIISKPVYEELEPETRQAGIDHELCHADFGPKGPSTIPHDFEDFNCIIDRHGFWSGNLKKLESKFKQMKMEFDEVEE